LLPTTHCTDSDLAHVCENSAAGHVLHILQTDTQLTTDRVAAYEAENHPTGMPSMMMCVRPLLAMTTDGVDVMAHVVKSNYVHVTVTG
jgi:hypothetical protein